MSKIKNLKKIGLKIIDDFQTKTQIKSFFNDPRGVMSDVDMSCSLLRKQLKKGYIFKSYYPKTIRSKQFDDVCEMLERILKKIRETQAKWLEKNRENLI